MCVGVLTDVVGTFFVIRNKWMYDDRASEREWKSKEGGTEGGRERERERERRIAKKQRNED